MPKLLKFLRALFCFNENSIENQSKTEHHYNGSSGSVIFGNQLSETQIRNLRIASHRSFRLLAPELDWNHDDFKGNNFVRISSLQNISALPSKKTIAGAKVGKQPFQKVDTDSTQLPTESTVNGINNCGANENRHDQMYCRPSTSDDGRHSSFASNCQESISQANEKTQEKSENMRESEILIEQMIQSITDFDQPSTSNGFARNKNGIVHDSWLSVESLPFEGSRRPRKRVPKSSSVSNSRAQSVVDSITKPQQTQQAPLFEHNSKDHVKKALKNDDIVSIYNHLQYLDLYTQYYNRFRYLLWLEEAHCEINQSIDNQTKRIFESYHNGLSHFERVFCESGEDKGILFPERKLQNSTKIILQDVDQIYFKFDLNTHQKQIVYNVLRGQCRPSPYIIRGQPTSGKSLVMAESIIQIHNCIKNSKILVCGSSESTVDKIYSLLRNSNRIAKNDLLAYSSKDVADKYILKSRIVLTTCIDAIEFHEIPLGNNGRYFDYIFIDDAWNCIEPETLIPIGLLKKDGCCVLAGGPHQSPARCQSPITFNHKMDESLMKRLNRCRAYGNGDTRYLGVLHRSYKEPLYSKNERIYSFREIYLRTPNYLLNQLDSHSAYLFIETFEDEKNECGSWYNRGQVAACSHYVKKLYQLGLRAEQVAIVTPFTAQVDKLLESFYKKKIKICPIGTPEQFNDRRSKLEVIILSSVRSKHVAQTASLYKRLQMIANKAKWLLFMIGNPGVLAHDEFWDDFHREAQKFKFDHTNFC